MNPNELAQQAYEAYNSGLPGSQKSTVAFSQLAPEIQSAWGQVVSVITTAQQQGHGDGEAATTARGGR